MRVAAGRKVRVAAAHRHPHDTQVEVDFVTDGVDDGDLAVRIQRVHGLDVVVAQAYRGVVLREGLSLIQETCKRFDERLSA